MLGILKRESSFARRRAMCRNTNSACLNYRPGFPSDDATLIRRMVLITFEFTYKDAHEIDIGNSKHKLMDTTLKPYFDSDEGAVDTLDFCVEGATMFYAKKREAPTSKTLSPIPEVFSAAARKYAEENDKLQMFIDELCITGVSFAVTKADFVEHFTTFLCAVGYDTSLAGDGLGRVMGIKGFPLKPLDGKKNKQIKMLHSKVRKGGFFGLRLKTGKEMQEE
jgi:phage/plasmid-associated DNA primase